MQPSPSQTPSVELFISDHVIYDRKLVVPVRVLWKAYQQFCEDTGFASCDAEGFVNRMLTRKSVVVTTGGRGRLKRCFMGVGFNPKG